MTDRRNVVKWKGQRDSKVKNADESQNTKKREGAKNNKSPSSKERIIITQNTGSAEVSFAMRRWMCHQAGVLRMFVYAGGSSTVSGSVLSAGKEGPASSCWMTLTGRKGEGMGDFLLMPVLVPSGDTTRWGSDR